MKPAACVMLLMSLLVSNCIRGQPAAEKNPDQGTPVGAEKLDQGKLAGTEKKVDEPAQSAAEEPFVWLCAFESRTLGSWLEVDANATGSSGAPVKCGERRVLPNQNWLLHSRDKKGEFQIEHRVSGKLLSVVYITDLPKPVVAPAPATKPGTPEPPPASTTPVVREPIVVQWGEADVWTSPNQVCRVEHVWHITNMKNGCSRLEMNNSALSAEADGKVKMKPWDGSPAQQWLLRQIP